jgi:hypothetical protein
VVPLKIFVQFTGYGWSADSVIRYIPFTTECAGRDEDHGLSLDFIRDVKRLSVHFVNAHSKVAGD